MSEKNTLPTKRANRRETDAYYMLCAALDALFKAEDDLKERAQLIPGGWRDLRCARAKAEGVMRQMLHTFEPEKVVAIGRQIKHLRVKTVFGSEASKDPEQFLMPLDDLAVLIHAARQECKLRMCPAGECGRCELGKVIDRASYVSRGDRAWWEVFDRAERCDIGKEEEP